MDDLRLILVGIGVFVIIGVYLLGRRRSAQRPEMQELAETQRARAAEDRVAPSLSPQDALEDLAGTPVPEPAEPEAVPDDAPLEMLVTLHVSFLQPRGLAAVRDALATDGLELGQHQVYHRIVGDAGSVFLVANMVEPGVLDGDDLDEVPGLSLFCQLPGPRDPTAAFADVIATARRLAGNLGGEVLDAHRSTLTRQTARLIREEIMAFQRRLSSDQAEQD
jgi:cell division protein ZipA